MTTTICLPARPFAIAWLNAALFASQDKAADHYRTIRLATAFQDGDSPVVDLAANSAYTTCRTSIDDDTVDDLGLVALGGTDPEGEWPIADVDHRGRSLAAYIVAATNGLDEFDDHPTVGITIRPVPSPQGALDGMERLEARIDFDGGTEVVTLPVAAIDPGFWRPSAITRQGGPASIVKVQPGYLGLLGKLKGVDPMSLRLDAYAEVIDWTINASVGTGTAAFTGKIATVRTPERAADTSAPLDDEVEVQESIDELRSQIASGELTIEGGGETGDAIRQVLDEGRLSPLQVV